MGSNTLRDLTDMSDNKACPTKSTRRIVRFEKPSSLKMMSNQREECNASQVEVTNQFGFSAPSRATGSCSQKLDTVSSPCQNKEKAVALKLARIRSLCKLEVRKQCEPQDKGVEINKISTTENSLEDTNSSVPMEKLVESTDEKLSLSKEISQQVDKSTPSDEPLNQKIVTDEAGSNSESKVLKTSNEPHTLKSSSASIQNDAPQVRTSTKNLIRLTQLTLNSSGEYKCEVSTGAPFFATNYRKANLTVIALPSQGPEITGLTSSYAVGENVTANCTSWPSVPKARIHWVVNNKTVSDHYVVEYPPLKPVDSKGLMTYPNSLGLRMELNSRHVAGSGGTLRVRCIAHVGSKKFETEKHVQLAHANNQRFSAGDLRSGGATCTLTVLLLLLTSGLAST